MRNVTPKNAKLIPESAERVFKGIIYDTYHWQQQMFDGSYQTFEMLKRPDTVEVIAVVDDKIVVTEQEQPGSGVYYDLPGGRHDVESEDELQCAKRELLEETGMRFKSWRLLDVFQHHNKIDYFIYTFLATDLIGQVEQQLDAGEKIMVRYYDLAAVQRLADNSGARHFSKEIIGDLHSIDDLLRMPEYG